MVKLRLILFRLKISVSNIFLKIYDQLCLYLRSNDLVAALDRNIGSQLNLFSYSKILHASSLQHFQTENDSVKNTFPAVIETNKLIFYPFIVVCLCFMIPWFSLQVKRFLWGSLKIAKECDIWVFVKI